MKQILVKYTAATADKWNDLKYILCYTLYIMLTLSCALTSLWTTLVLGEQTENRPVTRRFYVPLSGDSIFILYLIFIRNTAPEITPEYRYLDVMCFSCVQILF